MTASPTRMEEIRMARRSLSWIPPVPRLFWFRYTLGRHERPDAPSQLGITQRLRGAAMSLPVPPVVTRLGALALSTALALTTLSGRAATANSDWPAYAGDKASTKYSPLDQINRGNLAGLTIAWRRSALPEE